MEVMIRVKRIYLSMKYEQQYKTIKELLDHNGNKKRAAQKIGISIRQLNRRIKQYREKGKATFVHGNIDCKPVNHFYCIRRGERSQTCVKR